MTMRMTPSGIVASENCCSSMKAPLLARACLKADAPIDSFGLAMTPSPPDPPTRMINGTFWETGFRIRSANASLSFAGRGPETCHPAFPIPGPREDVTRIAIVYASSFSRSYRTSTFLWATPFNDSTNFLVSKLLTLGPRRSTQARACEAVILTASASSRAVLAEAAASLASLVSAAISAWPMTIPRTSPASPSSKSAIDNRLIRALSRVLSSIAGSSITYSPATPTKTKKAAIRATLSDGVNVANQRENATNSIVKVQIFICVVLFLNVLVRLGAFVAEIIRQNKSHKRSI